MYNYFIHMVPEWFVCKLFYTDGTGVTVCIGIVYIWYRNDTYMYLFYAHGTGVTLICISCITGVTVMYSYFHTINVICFNPLTVFITFLFSFRSKLFIFG